MKITAYKTVDIECEVDVEIEQILTEFRQRQEEATPDYWRRSIGAIDVMTRILADVPDDVIAAFPVAARATLCERLRKEAKRYEAKAE